MPLQEDPDLAAELLAPVLHAQNNAPRTVQATIGPSQIGGCREYLRSVFVGETGTGEKAHFAAEAFMGTATGDAIENAWLATLPDVRTQVPITVTLPKTGLVVAGHADATQPHRVLDLKSKNGLATIRSEGPSLENMIQVSLYLLGAVQMGIVEEGGYAALVYFDRSGKDKTFAAGKVDWEAALRFVDLAEERLLEVQEVIDRGSPEESRWALRDKEPSWCFAVECPFRLNCWEGSAWMPTEQITNLETIEAVARYIRARDDENDAKSRKEQAREDLRGISGITPDGRVLAWVGNTIRVREKI